MYIPIGILVVLFLINPTLALDIIFICALLYFWEVTLGIIVVLFIIRCITSLFLKIEDASEKVGLTSKIDEIFSYILKKIKYIQELHNKICNKIEEKTDNGGIISSIIIYTLQTIVLSIITFSIFTIAFFIQCYWI